MNFQHGVARRFQRQSGRRHRRRIVHGRRALDLRRKDLLLLRRGLQPVRERDVPYRDDRLSQHRRQPVPMGSDPIRRRDQYPVQRRLVHSQFGTEGRSGLLDVARVQKRSDEDSRRGECVAAVGLAAARGSRMASARLRAPALKMAGGTLAARSRRCLA